MTEPNAKALVADNMAELEKAYGSTICEIVAADWTCRAGIRSCGDVSVAARTQEECAQGWGHFDREVVSQFER
jgi:hypothetical protein